MRNILYPLALLVLLIFPAAGSPQFLSYQRDVSSAILDGNWQSCREDGQYSERVYDNKLPDGSDRWFEFHMGPFHDFAIFLGVKQGEDWHRDHDSSENLLYPHSIMMDSEMKMAKHEWKVLGLIIKVTLAGGSRDDCESWWITIVKDPNPKPPSS